jgi:hypothetical protein
LGVADDIYVRMPAQLEDAPHWLLKVTEHEGEVVLEVPDPGGQMTGSLAHGQDRWFEAWLDGRQGVTQVWATSWRVRDRALADELVDELVRRHGAQRLAVGEWSDAYDELHDFMWHPELRGPRA